MESLHSLTQFDESGQKVQFERVDYKGENLLTVLSPLAFQSHVCALHEVRVDFFSIIRFIVLHFVTHLLACPVITVSCGPHCFEL